MYKRVLIPLDGSRFAEQALSHAEALIHPGESEIHLLSVAPVLDTRALTMVPLYPMYVYRDYLDQERRESERITNELNQYLGSLADRFQSQGATVHIAVRFGQPAEEILAYADENDIDLIVMSTHGRSGLGRWVYGSVADKVLHGANIPVLLVRAHEEPS